MASHRRCLYFMWLRKLQIRELKMQLNEYLRRKRLLIIRMHLAYLQSIQSLRRSAIVLIDFFISAISLKKSSKGTPLCWQTSLTTFLYFSMKVMMALPQFLGMFLVQFLSFFSLISSFSCCCSGVFSSSDTPLSCVMTHDFSLKLLLYVTWGRMGVWQICMIELSLSSFLMSLSSMLLCSCIWSSCGKRSSSLISQGRSLCSWSQLFWSMEKLKMEEPSPGLISTEMLLMLERRLSSFIMLIITSARLYYSYGKTVSGKGSYWRRREQENGLEFEEEQEKQMSFQIIAGRFEDTEEDSHPWLLEDCDGTAGLREQSSLQLDGWLFAMFALRGIEVHTIQSYCRDDTLDYCFAAYFDCDTSSNCCPVGKTEAVGRHILHSTFELDSRIEAVAVQRAEGF